MTTTPEPTEEAEEHFCQACHAKRMAFEVLRVGVSTRSPLELSRGNRRARLCDPG